jgi:hypothetical protein
MATMKRNETPTPEPLRQQVPARPETDRLPYASPRLERLGSWSALTLNQSIPLFP